MQQLRTGQQFPLSGGSLCTVAEVGGRQRVFQHQLAVGADGLARLVLLGQGGHERRVCPADRGIGHPPGCG